MATQTEHQARAINAMVDVVDMAPDLARRLLDAARPHLVGWLVDDIAATTGTMRVPTDSSPEAANERLHARVLKALEDRTHVPALNLTHDIAPLDMLAGAITLHHGCITHTTVACYLCGKPISEVGSSQCDQTLARLATTLVN